MVRMDKDLKNKTQPEIRQIVEHLGAKGFLAGYLFQFIHGRFVTDIRSVSPLPKAFRERLIEEGYHISDLEVIDRLHDPDGTTKYLFRTPEGHPVESVLLRDAERLTLCISSQSGCRMGCAFCATGGMGFQSNLTAARIVDQVNRVARDGLDVHNVVYMGMGEPLDNLDEVLRSIAILKDKAGRNLGQRRITVSTCGLADGMARLAEAEPQVRLAVSLHAPDDKVRSALMPVNKRHGVVEVLDAVRAYQAATGRRVTFEYCLLQGINDHVTQARTLTVRLKGIKANVNLIEFNPFPGCDFKASDRPALERFAKHLQDHGIETVIRYKRGAQIRAACGQLGADFCKKPGDGSQETGDGFEGIEPC